VSARRAALLRGINLGSRRRVAMAELRELVEGLGYEDVATHLQSGNVVLTGSDRPERVARRIEGAIAERLGLDVDVVVRTGAQLRAVIERNPFPDESTDGAKLLVLFLGADPDPEAARGLDDERAGDDRIRARGREIYVWCPGGVQRSPGLAAIERRRLGVTATARNWNTVLRLAAMAGR
jgi:uncharacterized protein (DUF1697 family)